MQLNLEEVNLKFVVELVICSKLSGVLNVISCQLKTWSAKSKFNPRKRCSEECGHEEGDGKEELHIVGHSIEDVRLYEVY